MKIYVIGTGYVGLVTGSCLAKMGNDVTCIDNDKEKINNLLNYGKLPIYEPGLVNQVKLNINSNRLKFKTQIPNKIEKNSILFISVGTPSKKNGEADLTSVYQVAKDIGKKINEYCVIVNKSTVPVGTGDRVQSIIQYELDCRKIDIKFDVISNPEFLKEGNALKDFLYPDRIIIGSDSEKANGLIKQLYSPFAKRKSKNIFMSRRDAEMTKYAANAMLATKISFINEIAQICELTGVDVENVRQGIGSDKRIGYSFIYPGCGYGGSCLPKDINALIQTSKQNKFNPIVLNAVKKRNGSQKQTIFNKIIYRFGKDLSNYNFCIWGLSFKPGTNDMRESPSVVLIKAILANSGKVQVYDPISMKISKKEFTNIEINDINFCKSEYKALVSADAMILMTEWDQFRQPDFNKIKSKLKNPIIFDGRNQYNPNYLKKLGIEYFGIGRSNI